MKGQGYIVIFSNIYFTLELMFRKGGGTTNLFTKYMCDVNVITYIITTTNDHQ